MGSTKTTGRTYSHSASIKSSPKTSSHCRSTEKYVKEKAATPIDDGLEKHTRETTFSLDMRQPPTADGSGGGLQRTVELSVQSRTETATPFARD